MTGQDWLEKDFYAVLGVPKDADDAAIKKAYRKLARKYHPDQNQGDASAEAKFKEIGEAYAVLSDPKEREQYDAIRAMAGGGARFSAGPGGAGGDEREVEGHRQASTVCAGASASPPAPSSTTACSESLPRGSISPISTWTFWPILRTSSTFSTRLPPTSLRICEMCSRPSLPGDSEMNAPNVVVFTTVPTKRSPTSGMCGLAIALIAARAASADGPSVAPM